MPLHLHLSHFSDSLTLYLSHSPSLFHSLTLSLSTLHSFLFDCLYHYLMLSPFLHLSVTVHLSLSNALLSQNEKRKKHARTFSVTIVHCRNYCLLSSCISRIVSQRLGSFAKLRLSVFALCFKLIFDSFKNICLNHFGLDTVLKPPSRSS